MSVCSICPRKCGVDRSTSRGFCGVGNKMLISRVMRHTFEEPCISGPHGAGAIFFTGCNLGCIFCQNASISRPAPGNEPGDAVSPEELADIMLGIQAAGLSTVDLVTPTHFTPQVAAALRIARERGLALPVVWNSGGYESVETLTEVAGLIDVYMPDLKYFSPELSEKYSAAADYADRAAECIAFMYRTLGEARIEDGVMRRGVLVRHLVLPGCRRDSLDVLRRLADIVPPSGIKISLMSQYSPEFYRGPDKALCRRVTSFEYDSVVAEADSLGFDGYMQARTSSGTKYTPDFGRHLTIDADCKCSRQTVSDATRSERNIK